MSKKKSKTKRAKSKRAKGNRAASLRKLEAREIEENQAERQAKSKRSETQAKSKRAESKKAEGEKKAAAARAEELAMSRREDERREDERREADRRGEDRRLADRQAKAALAEEAEADLPLPAPPSLWQRLDLGVLFFALAIFAGGTLVTRQLATPKQIPFSESGLQFQRPAGWLPAQSTTSKVAGLARTTSGFGVAHASTSSDASGTHLVYQSPRDSRQRIQVHIGPRPPYRNLRGARAIERLGDYGEFYWEAESRNHSIARRDWVRTEFRYAFKPSKSGSPQIANAVEYATIQDTHLYVVTLHGDPKSMSDLDTLIAPTLRIGNAGDGTSEAEAATGAGQ